MSLRILVAEDNQDLADTYKIAFESRGHVITTVRDGVECLKTYLVHVKNSKDDSESLFDAIILDQQIPGMSGVDVAREIQRVNPKQRIIFITGYGAEVIKELREFQQEIEIINKPFALKTLIAQIERYSSAYEEKPRTKITDAFHEISAYQQPSDKEMAVKRFRTHLTPAKEIGVNAERVQLPESHKVNLNQLLNYVSHGEINNLIRKQNRISHDSVPIEKKIQKINSKNIPKAELIVLPILAVLFFYAIVDYYQLNSADGSFDIKTRYVVEDLQGQSSVTQYWSIVKGTPLTVNIVNPSKLSQEKINVIKNAILSTDVFHVDSSFLDKSAPGGKSYFMGWKGALATTNNTMFYIPDKFNVIESDTGQGQIVITLSHVKDPSGYSSYTRLVTDDSQILKSFITIYDANNLSDNQLAALTRHEFGRALGLPYSDDPQDLMHDTIQTNYPYISECDISTMQSLYNGNAQNKVICSM